MRRAVSAILAGLLAAALFTTGANAREEMQAVYVTYEQFDAVGDGVEDDFDAICDAHAYANANNLPVKADPEATYRIVRTRAPAEIRTNTEWGGAHFIIDDSNVGVAERGNNIFRVSSGQGSVPVTDVATLRKGQEKLDWSLGKAALVSVTDNTTIRFIREGANQNDGTAQTEVFVVDAQGNVDPRTPIVWDYGQISAMRAYPVDAETLTVSGGHFTTIANRAPSEYTYYGRGIQVTRSNVVIDGFTHAIEGELDHGAPYNGFLAVNTCAGVTVKECWFSGHKTYRTIGSAGTGVSMGSYDISAGSAANVSFRDCKQLNDMLDPDLWGIMGSNFTKNLVYDGCELSRFDAHMGTVNATVRNSVLRTISVTGFGTFLVENTKVINNTLIGLRGDYGSFWDGEFVIRNCVFAPSGSGASLISASNSGKHDFGYPCMMPQKVTIDGLVIEDGGHPFFYFGPYIFDYFNPNLGLCNPYPYAKTQEVTVKNVSAESGRCLLKSKYWYAFMLWGVKVKRS